MTNPTLDYYNKYAVEFSKDTFDVKFTETQDLFLSLLKPNSCILDFGCGSGRDTRYFLQQGYRVEAIDGSKSLCEIAQKNTGIPIRQMLFQDLRESDEYDGIWACSSILHLAKNELTTVMKKMIRALKKNGIIYTSFKYGDFEGERNGRYFTDFTEKSFAEFLEKLKIFNENTKNTEDKVSEITIEKIWITEDVRPGRGDEKWLNLILRKS
ncbi:class I SAM-dependent methyltransferase [Brotaphodocola catenula]|uniref:Class I SAM-dependent methyltransferase n=1 Tax=Brotaphodocola catenula TaxID=2885361 RepID=A0AAE3ATT2_9FIRM|nr:class I SAM-dependent methyltransferase [Brotaphodocola catenula]MCC2165789.1 class I SAM-dependent methyltransferase [Brotaphodocola catenula]